ncbi:MAG: TraB/GumN family protein [Prochloron sp. SP5CPC1]|nr:TraB/GumN family protein [Candidatus Paraprochloron terpiosi SP5CPC1]
MKIAKPLSASAPLRETSKSIPQLLINLLSITLVIFTPTASNVANAQTQESKTFLWKVDSPQNTLYLLGSVHFLKAENYPLPQPMEAAFDDAEGVVFEVNFNEAQDRAVQQLVLQKAQPEAEETLIGTLSAQTYNLAKQKAAELGLPMEPFHNFEPWFFTFSFLPLKLQQLGFEASYGVDQYFFRQAVAENKEIVALETLEYQINLFDNLSAEEQEDLLLQTLLELDTLETYFNNLITAWFNGDLAEFTALFLASFADYPDLKEKFLTQRNRNWLPIIEFLLQQKKDYLVVVGAGHLLGEEGLIQLLENRGYLIEQVTKQ